MSFDLNLIHTAIISRHGMTDPPAVDRYGTPVETDIGVAGYPAWLEQSSSQEVLAGQDVVVASDLLVLPATADVDATDRVEVVKQPFDNMWQTLIGTGDDYEILGKPGEMSRPRDGLHHIELRLRRIT